MKKPTTYKKYIQNFTLASESLSRAKDEYNKYEELSSLVRDSRLDILDELRAALYEEQREAVANANNNGYSSSGFSRGLARAISILDDLRSSEIKSC